MSSKLKAITTRAKTLYKTGKFSKWTDAIKEASKQIGTGKKVSGVKTKKKATKKASKKVTKKKATPKSYHKDTKSHNVNVKVVSGIGAIKKTALTHLKDSYGKISIKKMTEKTKREKNKLQKELNEIKKKIKQIHCW